MLESAQAVSYPASSRKAPPLAPLAGGLPARPDLILASISDLVELIDPQGIIIESNLTPTRRRELGHIKPGGAVLQPRLLQSTPNRARMSIAASARSR
jgi:hypothetical protein